MSYGGDSDRGPFLSTLNWVLQALSLVAVALRLLSPRLRDTHTWGIDDAFTVLAVTVHLARSIFMSMAISAGFGRHLDELLEHEPPEKVARLLQYLVVLQAIGLWTFTLPKLPVVALLVRLFGRVTRIALPLYSSALALILLVTAMTITTFVQCSPVAAQWDTSIKGDCWNRDINVDLGYLAGSYSALLDCSYALCAILQLRNLKMERPRKILIAGSMSLGFVGGIVTIYKLTTINQINNTQDPTWATIPLEVWNSVEGCTLILAACGPLLRPLTTYLCRRWFGSRSRLNSSDRSGPSNWKAKLVIRGDEESQGVNASSTLRQASSVPPYSDDDVSLFRKKGHPQDMTRQLELQDLQGERGQIRKIIDIRVDRKG